MATLTQNTLNQIAEQAAAYIANLYSDDTFEVEVDDYLAVIACRVIISEDKGDYYTAPSWQIEGVEVDVKDICDEEGKSYNEAVNWLNMKLN